MTPLEQVLARLEGVRRSGDGYQATCPGHDDTEPSLSVAEGRDQPVVLRCFAGCPPEAILAALGLSWADVCAENGSGLVQTGYTVEDYRRDRLLPLRFLRDLGLRTIRSSGHHSPAIAIPYHDAEGQVIATRLRTDRSGGGRFKWLKGTKPALYGLDRLAAADSQRGVLLVEGESDCHALWFHDVLTVGVPGAGAWRSEWASLLAGRTVFAWREPDDAGREFVRRLAADLPDLRVIEAPDGAKDPSDLHVRDRAGFRDRLADLVRTAVPAAETLLELTELEPVDGRAVLTFAELLDDDAVAGGVKWDLRPFTARGTISLLSAAPKAGKSTWAGHYAHAKANGDEFLGQQLQAAPVLLVPLDEPLVAVVRRHTSLGTPGDQLHVWDLRRDPEPTVPKIAALAAEIGARLVIVDTLGRIARVPDENDNAAWIRWFSEVDHHIRVSDAAWLFLHHDRKSGGSEGTGIRGASAIFGCVDVAFSLHRDQDDRRRRILRIEGSRLEEADDVVIALAENGTYELVGEFRLVRILEDEEVQHVRAVLDDDPVTVTEIGVQMEETGSAMPETTLRRQLGKLVSAGVACQVGKGGRNDPYRFGLAPRSASQGAGPTERTPSTLQGQDGASGASSEPQLPQRDATSALNGTTDGPILHTPVGAVEGAEGSSTPHSRAAAPIGGGATEEAEDGESETIGDGSPADPDDVGAL